MIFRLYTICALFLVAVTAYGGEPAQTSSTHVAVHKKFRHVIIGPDANKVVAVACRSAAGKLLDAYLTMSSGDDDIDSQALEFVKSQPYAPLEKDGKLVDSCREIVVHVDRDLNHQKMSGASSS